MKNISICILEILKEHSNEEHRLSQKQIREYLQSDYGLNCDRKAVHRNLEALLDLDFPIEYKEKKRTTAGRTTGETVEDSVLSDFYFVHDFTDSELRFLIDCLMFSKNIPASQGQELVAKLEKLSSKHFRSKNQHIHTMNVNAPENPELFLNIDLIDEALTKEKQVSFFYNRYGADKKLHPVKDKEGNPRITTVTPLQIVAANGRHYMIACPEGAMEVRHYRLDKITNMELTTNSGVNVRKLKGFEQGLQIPKHMAEHVYMHSGESERVNFRANRAIIDDVVDWFGGEASFTNTMGDTVDVWVRCNRSAFVCWALQYCRSVEVLSPLDVREEVASELRKAAEKYAMPTCVSVPSVS